jgi:transposase-like protein
VQPAYVCGVSTRCVDQLVESLGLRISRSEVSRISGLLDEQVAAFGERPLEGRYPYVFVDAKMAAFGERPLEGRYPYVFVDAKIEKVRNGGRVARKSP